MSYASSRVGSPYDGEPYFLNPEIVLDIAVLRQTANKEPVTNDVSLASIADATQCDLVQYLWFNASRKTDER